MIIVWIVLSVIIIYMIVETITSMWLNSGIEEEHTKGKWSFINIRKKFAKKKAS